jgi:hypothetical protein
MMNEEEREAFLNTPILPGDAGEYADGLMDVMNRIPLGWGRWISCGPGWYKIIIEANEKLKFIDPDYEIQQVKEKYGTLRYYFGSKFNYESIQYKIMQTIVDYAEYLSENTCEECGTGSWGTEVETRATHGWLSTNCKECYDKRYSG